jgi:hypothetical protein
LKLEVGYRQDAKSSKKVEKRITPQKQIATGRRTNPELDAIPL